MDEYGVHYAKKIDCHYDEIVVKLNQFVRYLGEMFTYNVFQNNGYNGAVDFSKFRNGKYAEDYDNFSYSFKFDLKFGDEGPEIQLLQTALQILGHFPKDHPLTPFLRINYQKCSPKIPDKIRNRVSVCSLAHAGVWTHGTANPR